MIRPETPTAATKSMVALDELTIAVLASDAQILQGAFAVAGATGVAVGFQVLQQ